MDLPSPFSKLLLIIFLFLPFTISGLDTITSTHPLRDGEVLVCARKAFALGFFSPPNSHKRYVGIWYKNVTQQTVVWVANRDNPINDSSGVLAINGRGKLIIYGHQSPEHPIWVANISARSSPNNNNSVAKLLDVGNLVLFHNTTSQQNDVVWQSFDYPTDTMLPFMKLGLDRKSGLDRFLTSWKSTDDPGTGNCSYRIDPNGYPQLFLYKGRVPWWRGGPWTGHRWSGVPEMTPNFIFNVSYVNNQDEISITYGILNDSIFSKMAVEESGLVERSTWQVQTQGWNKFWSAPTEWCDEYGKCGANGNCDPSITDKFECSCLPGFEPKSPRDWFLRDASSGCVRKQGVRTCRSGEGFVRLTRVKAPDTSKARVNMSLGLKACEEVCLGDCNCTGYMSADDRQGGIGCLTWHGNLVDTRMYPTVGQDLYVRVDATTLAEYAKGSNNSISKGWKVAISVGSAMVLCFFLVLLAYLKAKRKRKVKERQNAFPYSASLNSTYFEDSPARKELDESTRNSDLPFFGISTIAAATGKFSDANKLGEGGFGSVYKGVLHNGKEIAVKRLSKYSGQGSEEFKNEVMLIAKLQHRNLVRILGFCVHEDEKMLIYEYLPNKSLDFFIFNETNRKILDWRKRFDIICGIARGILYLHQDSRLRIIHRDLKASNILLDEAMNPKIADFGMARIFGTDQIEANTNRVVGTYGYMSPEYAMEGLFSIKSDVYSFGVLMLEIITGKKNSGYFHEETDSNLVGHVWNLWRDGKCVEILDSSLDESFTKEASRCIQIGLLCVQEHASDRPSMSTVIFMLGNDAALPYPKPPAFVIKRSGTSGDPSTSANSINEVTCTVIEAR
ncbi:G-type lectin S-receptor-like serine/threonine-protein kinase RKS1 [Ziziphus jujuba]|uniref:Receptor-like serine/threonine-protein kinase n=1 Tax=Ziziphus jujuba TaxID=326968 RepID=A0A6P4ALJ4_ZIZJJ|nr:G-type lectin S-receptor-like serine/threonine-protein kinase RKS1 [Ziziphus jujuba]